MSSVNQTNCRGVVCTNSCVPALDGGDQLIARTACQSSLNVFKSAVPGGQTLTNTYQFANGLREKGTRHSFDKNQAMEMLLNFTNFALDATDSAYDLCVLSLKSMLEDCFEKKAGKRPMMPQTTK